MTKTGIGMALLLFWAAVLIYIVALVWRRFAKLDPDDEAVAARRRRRDADPPQNPEQH